MIGEEVDIRKPGAACAYFIGWFFSAPVGGETDDAQQYSQALVNGRAARKNLLALASRADNFGEVP